MRHKDLQWAITGNSLLECLTLQEHRMKGEVCGNLEKRTQLYCGTDTFLGHSSNCRLVISTARVGYINSLKGRGSRPHLRRRERLPHNLDSGTVFLHLTYVGKGWYDFLHCKASDRKRTHTYDFSYFSPFPFTELGWQTDVFTFMYCFSPVTRARCFHFQTPEAVKAYAKPFFVSVKYVALFLALIRVVGWILEFDILQISWMT